MAKIISFEEARAARAPGPDFVPKVLPVPRREGLMNAFAETNFSEQNWPRLKLLVPADEVRLTMDLLRLQFGFSELEKGDFDPGEWNVFEPRSVIALKAAPERSGWERDSWTFEGGFWVCAQGDWYFKRDLGGDFFKVLAGERLFLKPNPRLFPSTDLSGPR